MAIYMTEQRKKLFSFLQENHDKQFSAKQIAERISDSLLSLSAIYRNLSFLEEQGFITRSVRDGSNEIFFQYIHSDECRQCIHLTCIKCGKTCHMNKTESDRMIENVFQKDKFQIAVTKTVLYGLCGDCI